MTKSNDFKDAINDKQKVRITFVGKDGQRFITHTCAPLDLGPHPKAKDKTDKFSAWDYDSLTQEHEISLYPNHIQKIEVLPESFDPKDVVTPTTKAISWFYKRDWGIYS